MVTKVKQLIVKAGSQLLKPSPSNSVFLYSWSPGYKIYKTNVDSSGAEKVEKKFVPTSTFEAAVAFLKNEYGSKEYLRFKEDAHPGHVSIEAGNAYLSVGPDGALNSVGLQTQHRIHYTRKFEIDLVGFLRPPENILDFYSLDSQQVEKAIFEFKNAQLIYSLLGNRLYKTEGESCATSAFITLEAGGIQDLLRIDQWLRTKHSILTPASLTRYVTAAREKEQILYPESISLSTKLLQEKQEYAEKILENYFATVMDDMQNNIPNESNKRGPSK